MEGPTTTITGSISGAYPYLLAKRVIVVKRSEEEQSRNAPFEGDDAISYHEKSLSNPILVLSEGYMSALSGALFSGYSVIGVIPCVQDKLTTFFNVSQLPYRCVLALMTARKVHTNFANGTLMNLVWGRL